MSQNQQGYLPVSRNPKFQVILGSRGGVGGIWARWTPLTLSMLLPKAAVAETPEVDIPHSNPFQMDNTIQIPNDTKRFFETAAVEMKYWCGITFPYLPFITTIPFISSISK